MAKKEFNWTEADIELLRDKFQSWSAISIALRLRKSVNAVRLKASELKIEKQKPKPWTTEEYNILKKYYPTEGANGVMERLPDRSIYAIKHVAQKNGIRFKLNPTPSKRLIENEPISAPPSEWDSTMRMAVCGRWA